MTNDAALMTSVGFSFSSSTCKDTVAKFVQAGAGIVSDSIPMNEWVETQNKAKAILKAAELVQARITE